MPESKRDRDEQINDLTVYAKLLNESDPYSPSFNHVFDVLSEDEYRVSLATFAIVMSRIPLNEFAQSRLKKIQTLLEWTNPHVPDLAPFSALWFLTCVVDEDEMPVEVEDESSTTHCLEMLFSDDPDELIEALEHDCVLVRVAATISGSGEPFENALDEQRKLTLEHAIYFGCGFEEYMLEVKPGFDEALANYSGDNEDKLPEYPYTATECKCVSGWVAVENYFESLKMFWLEGRPHFGEIKPTGQFAAWSTRLDAESNKTLNFEEKTFISIALPTALRKYYEIQFAYGELVLSFATIPGYPRGDWDTWLASWDERIDMLQSFLERISHSISKGADNSPQRKFLWRYEERFVPDGSVEIFNQIFELNAERTAYATHDPIDFNSGFYFLRHELFGI
jgi:hypothetical protein